MSEYLLNIVARSMGNNATGLLPSKPVFNSADAGTVQDFAAENNIEDNALQNKFVEQKIGLHKTGAGFSQNNIETSYFSKHIERVETGEEEINLVKNKATETISFKIDEGAPQAAALDNKNLNEPVVNKIVSKIAPGRKDTKKQIIQPSGKSDEFQNKKINLSEKVRLERITPNQPEQMHKRLVQNSKKNETVPKLIIGKIIVEILPPKLPVTQRTLTKVVQSSSKDNYSKSNKLIFGLGQL